MTGLWRTWWGATICIALAGWALVFVFEHRAHALQWLPFLIILACPLMHFFMHRGHGHGHGDGGSRPAKEK